MAETRTSPTSTLVNATEIIRHIIELASHDLPFAAHVTQLAAQGTSLDELAHALGSVYRIALDEGHSFLPDLVDLLLSRVEQARDAGISGSAPWRGAL